MNDSKGGAEQKRSPYSSYNFSNTLLQRFIEATRRFFPQGFSSLINLEQECLLRRAFELTGLDDMGEQPWDEPLSVLLQSIETDARLNLIGRICFRSDILRMLCNRLYLQQARKAHPQIAEQIISGPVFITGLPRTGSTLLHALLAQDPQSRAPQVWEVMHPTPPPERASYKQDPRVYKTARELKWLDIIIPGFKKAHMIDARLPQECIAITGHSFISYLFESMYFVHSYRAWHEKEDKGPAYEYHKQFLQHLQWRAPGTHWALKAPSHLFALKTLLQVYPDARIVLTHRDPLSVLPSCASFTELLRGAFTNTIDKKQLGAEIAQHWQKGSRIAVDFCKSQGDGPGHVLNIFYNDLVKNPLAVVRSIYRHFDMKLTAEAEAAMRVFLARNPQNNHGVHRYTLCEYGFDPETERRRFAPYTGFFGIEPEKR
ncbi:MAG: sulfotransferase family protein [Syntrophobacteraceae bacterium]